MDTFKLAIAGFVTIRNLLQGRVEGGSGAALELAEALHNLPEPQNVITRDLTLEGLDKFIQKHPHLGRLFLSALDGDVLLTKKELEYHQGRTDALADEQQPIKDTVSAAYHEGFIVGTEIWAAIEDLAKALACIHTVDGLPPELWQSVENAIARTKQRAAAGKTLTLARSLTIAVKE